MAQTRLVNLRGLEAATGIPARTLKTFYQTKKIPYNRIGHRTILFDPVKVRVALDRFEVRPITV